jgi:hypothetical protein
MPPAGYVFRQAVGRFPASQESQADAELMDIKPI